VTTIRVFLKVKYDCAVGRFVSRESAGESAGTDLSGRGLRCRRSPRHRSKEVHPVERTLPSASEEALTAGYSINSQLLPFTLDNRIRWSLRLSDY
jgi:hypothetical protein